ncbi:uncharacterized [Tachysurus ichikawai]
MSLYVEVEGATEMKSQLERHMDVFGSEHGHTAHGSGSKCTHNCAIGRRRGEALHRARSQDSGRRPEQML